MRLVGWSTTLETLAPRLRCSQRGKKAAEGVTVRGEAPAARGAEESALTRSLISVGRRVMSYDRIGA